MKDSQEIRILRWLAQGKTLTGLQALRKFGVMALSQRCTRLRAHGWPVESEMIRVGSKRIARYSLPPGRPA